MQAGLGPDELHPPQAVMGIDGALQTGLQEDDLDRCLSMKETKR